MKQSCRRTDLRVYQRAYQMQMAKCLSARPQWPRRLRGGFVAARLLGLRVRILPGDGCLSLLSVICS